jgi:hypothetical protein
MSKTRLWLERLGVALITVIAIGTPIALGLFSYLALTDGIDWGAGDPLHQGRLWMLRERRDMVGLGLMYQTDNSAPQPGLICSRTNYSALIWSPALTTERNSSTCQCYVSANGQLTQSPTPCP